MTLGLDAYTRNARLKPALIAILPVAWTIMAWAPGNASGWGGLWTLFVAGGGTWLLSQVARDRGKKKEDQLFAKFGGRPTEQLLSHGCAHNTVRLRQRHAKLATLMPNLRVPSAEEEIRAPAAAHEIYQACTAFLISRTRDDRVLFQENMNYGFRRNLWGLKPVGIVVSAGTALVLGLRLYRELLQTSTLVPILASAEVLNILMLIAWVGWITPAWVMIPARAYAERLLDGLDRL